MVFPGFFYFRVFIAQTLHRTGEARRDGAVNSLPCLCDCPPFHFISGCVVGTLDGVGSGGGALLLCGRCIIARWSVCRWLNGGGPGGIGTAAPANCFLGGEFRGGIPPYWQKEDGGGRWHRLGCSWLGGMLGQCDAALCRVLFVLGCLFRRSGRKSRSRFFFPLLGVSCRLSSARDLSASSLRRPPTQYRFTPLGPPRGQ